MLNFYSPYLAGFFLFLMVALVSCSEEERIKLVEDNLTDNQPITGVAAVEQDPTIVEGNNLFLQGDFEQAILKYEEGLKNNRAVAFYNMGVSYYQLNDIEKSAEFFQKAVDEDPKFTEAYINLAVVLLQTNKLDEAEKYMDELLKYKATGKLLVNMANIYLKKGETARASVLYEEALKKDSKSRFVRSNYAYFLLSIGEYYTGITMIEGLEYKNYNDYFNLGTAYFLNKNYELSIKNLLLAEKFQETEEVYDLLAKNYEQLKQYADEVEVLKKLVEMNGTKDYRFRYAYALYKNGSYGEAHDVMTALINDFPKDSLLYVTDYNILTALKDYEQAGTVIKKGFDELNEDSLMYMYAKHMLIYSNIPREIHRLIYSRPSSPYVELAKSMYEVYAGNMLPAQKFLDKVPPATDNDYYVYRAYIMMKYRNYGEALKAAELIDKFKPEYFWYKTVNLWNMKNIKELQEHVKETITYNYRTSRAPKLSMHIEPVLEDMNFSYIFNGDFEGVVASVLYPLLIEPDEMLSFVAFGYKLLQQNEKLLALEELQKSVRFSEGIAHNNKGVTLFLAYAYEDALREFQAADKLLGSNPYTLFNIGLVHLAMGRTHEAEKYFDDSITLNRYNFPSYLGKAVAMKTNGDAEGAYQQYNLIRDRAADISEDRGKVPDIIYATKYLADMGVGDYTNVIKDINKRKPVDGFLRALLSLAEYFNMRGFDKLSYLDSSKIFRGAGLRDLLSVIGGHPSTQNPAMITDRFYRFMRTYVNVEKFKKTLDINYDVYMRDSIILKEFIYYQVYMGDSKRALYYMQRLNNLDSRYPELYKASLYYFLWMDDFINARASYVYLENLGYQDRFFDYYKMLYFIMDYDADELRDRTTDYISKYPNDFRGEAIKLLNNLKNDSINEVYNELGDLESRSGNFLLKLPLELEIDGL